MEDRGFDEEDAIMRQYTWTNIGNMVKASGMLGGQKNASPTVISRSNIRKDQLSLPFIIPSRSQSDLGEENTQVSMRWCRWNLLAIDYTWEA
uniref:Uncharacterized protein n=1 Tax=Salix viminalis TaxID=40686 RepID=A0A6N2KYY2_SALVM